MTVDLNHTLRLVGVAEEMIHDRSILVSESGITTREDLLKLRSVGVRIALIGEHLMRQEDPGGALGTLLRSRFGD
jgi:indole-3-glycerol phosphate synthase